MSELPDMRILLDEAIGDGPPPRSPHESLLAGKRAVRRRNVAGSVGLTLCLVAIGFAVSIQNTAPRTAPSQIATQAPTKAAEPTATPPPPDPPLPWAKEEILRYSPNTDWEVNPKFQVLTLRPNPYRYFEPDTSIAVDAMRGTKHVWIEGIWTNGTLTASTSSPVGEGRGALLDWIALQKAPSANDPEGQMAVVRFENGTLVSAERSTQVLEVVPNPDLPTNFASKDTLTAAAEINQGGEKSFLVARDIGTPYPDVITWPDTDGLDSLADFINFARGKYESGEGLR